MITHVNTLLSAIDAALQQCPDIAPPVWVGALRLDRAPYVKAGGVGTRLGSGVRDVALQVNARGH